MVKTRKSARIRKKKSPPELTNVALSKKSSNSEQKTPNNKSKTVTTPIRNVSPNSSSSGTSPFKGYEPLDEEPRLYGSFLQDGDENVVFSEVKEDLFDRLVNEQLPSNLHRNIRTYTNKKKVKPMTENTVLEFQNCKNRNEILEWLNDNRNVFDRLTQTQTECVVNLENCTQMTLDMPSVSQQNTPKVNRTKRETKRTKRSPYKLRARSLDIVIKKNLQKGRNRSHSLAGDTPIMENYRIEDVNTDDEPVPAHSDKIIIDLMEDEYLDNIEREMMQNEEKKNGWDRIKDINKTINSTKKQPKQLKIVLQSSETKKGDSDTDVPCYDYDVLENYFVENMDKLLQDEKDRSSRSSTSKNSNGGRFTVKNAIQVGKNLIMCLKKVLQNEGQECLKEFEPVMSELKKVFKISLTESGTQTRNLQTSDKLIQTVQNTVNTFTQTERNLIHASMQTDQRILNTSEKNIQVGADAVDVEVQTEDVVVTKRLFQQLSSATPSDIFENEGEREEVHEAFNADFKSEEVETEAKSDVFDDDLNFDFDTEDLLKNERLVKEEKKDSEIVQTGESVLVVSAQSRAENKGVKRQSESPVDLEEFPKRPCAKFIREDLSVAFNSCVERELGDDKERTREVIVLSEGSYDDDDYIQLCKKYENNTEQDTTVSRPPKTKTQEQIEELEDMIDNAMKPSTAQIERHKSHDSPNKLDDSDYFKPASYVLEAEKTPKKSRRGLFNSRNDSVEPSPNIFSESMFDSNNRNITVIANGTLTEQNVDVMVRDISKNEKVNILENVILRVGQDSSAKSDGYESENSDVFSDVDVVESTPQKRVAGDVQREESVLDITLPPPLEFQDSGKPCLEHNTSKVFERFFSPPRRPLAVINKITSTPVAQRFESQNSLNLSPISCHGKIPGLKPRLEENSGRKSLSNIENTKTRCLYEVAKQQLGKFSPLTIVKKPLSQESCRLGTTPKQKSILNYVRPSQEKQESPKSESFELSGERKPCIACSRVSRDQVFAISSLTNKKLATYSTSFSPKVTHLIVSTNERNCLQDHTIKFVSAVAAGIWVLSFGWVRKCLSENALVPEEPFEVLDVSGVPGPRQARLMRSTNPLFEGYKIHAAAPFASTTQQEVENVVRMLGGKVVPSPEHLLDKNGYICVIVTEARATQDFELYETWLEALKVVTVDIEWLSRSVGQYKLLSLRPFTLCSDDTIESLGYPLELTANMTYSFSQQTFSSVPSST